MERKGADIALLFISEQKSDSFSTQPFVFLVPAYYVQHQDSHLVIITWKLKHPIPSKY